MESRLFYIKGFIEKRHTIEDLDVLIQNLRKYGVDTNDESVFSMDFKGNVKICDLLYEQCECVMRAIWNLCMLVKEVGEQIYDEEEDEIVDYPISKDTPERRKGASMIRDDLDAYMDGKPVEEDSEEGIEDESE